MLVVKLGSSMYCCPVQWQNFIRGIQLGIPGGSVDNGVPHEMINEHLKEYNGAYRVVSKKGYREARLVFGNKQDYLVFVLKNS